MLSTLFFNSSQVLETVDDKLEKTDISFVKFNDEDYAEEKYGITEDDLPKLLFFDNQIPVQFPSDAKISEEKDVTSWILEQVDFDILNKFNFNDFDDFDLKVERTSHEFRRYIS